MNRMQSKKHGIVTYKINEFFLSCFGDKMHVLNNGHDGLAVILITTQNTFFCQAMKVLF